MGVLSDSTFGKQESALTPKGEAQTNLSKADRIVSLGNTICLEILFWQEKKPLLRDGFQRLPSLFI